jgi:IS30 family transposase
MATFAHEQYRRELVSSREGINLTQEQRDEIADLIVPLVNKGQSIYQILSTHKETIRLSEKTIYNYIDMGVFRKSGLTSLSLKEKVKRRQFKNKYKKRKEPVNYYGRKYKDYLNFVKENAAVLTVEMDTVMNHPSGPYIQTLLFEKTNFMIGFLHQERTSSSMARTLDDLQELLVQNGKRSFMIPDCMQK